MKIKIVNMSKFIRGIVIVAVIVLLLMLIVSNTTLSYGDNNYKEIYVGNGDTLWSIAKEEQKINEYYENKDIRDVVNNIKFVNKLSNSNLNVNQKIVIPSI